MRVNQAAVNAVACTIAIESSSAAASSERNWSRELQLSMPLSTNEEEKGRGEKGRGEKGRGERRKKKLEKIAAALRSETSMKSGATIDDGLMGRAAKSAKSSKKFVECIAGFTVEDPGVTCADACGGDCCVGPDSCDGFTGSVAKDGSCNDFEACFDATIGVVSGGSCDGPNACSFAKIGVVSGKSCKGPSGACSNAEIGVISGGSCQGDRACSISVIGVVSGGSCKGPSACRLAKIEDVSGQSCDGG